MSERRLSVSLDSAVVDEIFPFHLVLDQELRVVHAGPRASKVCPGLASGRPFLELFSIYRPRTEATFDAICRASSATFIVDSSETQLRMRGQMLRVSDALVFLGRPWFTDIEELRRSDLELRDFTVHDPTVDFLYMVQAKSLALADATRFGETIARQRDELRAANEQLARASAAKSQFLANTSHELRTPLNGIMGMAAVLLLEDLPRRHHNYVEKILGSARALLAVVNDVLDFAKIEAGKVELQISELDAGEVVQEAAELFAVAAYERGVEVSCFVQPTIERSFLGDAGRLRQVISNLLGNAVKFTSHGEIEVSVRVREERDGATVLRFSVSDTGIGIEPSARSTLFAPFSQVDGSMSRPHGGTGLGLAISRQLLELMQGTIDVTSEPGIGSTFFFDVPLAHGVSVLERPATLHGRRIMVVTASRTLAQHIEAIVTHVGGEVELVDDPAFAMATVVDAGQAGHPFDAAVLDMNGPGLRGLDIARWITRQPTCDPTRIVLLQSLAQPESADTSARVDAIASKPIRAARLIAAIARDCPRDSAPPQGLWRGAAAAHVLVVEDHPVNREVAVAMLEALGCTAEVAADGAQALTVFETGKYDLILMDLQMPRMDGYAATAEIRRRERAGPRVPIVALSAHAMDVDRDRALAAGMDDYLSKPIEVEALSSALTRWIEKMRAPAAPSAAPTRDAIDGAVLHELRRYERAGKDLIGDVVTKFLHDLPDRLHDLRRAAKRGDGPGLAAPAHALSGSSAVLGAVRFGELAAQLEDAASMGDVDRARSLFDLLESEATGVRAELESLLRDRGRLDVRG